jgi:prepilin-type N-terminal cleavage/methylation domain-containing protein
MKEMVLKRMGLAGHNKKGFTLVEVIVVLVIITILMAIAVPALTGYIDRAKDKALEADGRNILVALQAIASEEYGRTGTAVTWDGTTTNANKPNGTTGGDVTSSRAGALTISAEINDLVGEILVNPSTTPGDKSLTQIDYDKGVKGFVYQVGSTNAKKITYAEGTGFTIS